MPIADSVAPPGTQLLSFHWVLHLAVARQLLSAAHLGVLRLIRMPWTTQRCNAEIIPVLLPAVHASTTTSPAPFSNWELVFKSDHE